MKYLLLLMLDGPADGLVDPGGGPQAGAVEARYLQLRRDLQGAGVWCGGEVLQPADSATALRVRDGRVVLHDGPSAGADDRLVGYFLVDCDDLDHAIEVAARIPLAQHGTVDIRPVHDRHPAMLDPGP